MDDHPEETPRPDGAPSDVAPTDGAGDMDQTGALGPDRDPEPPPFVVVGLGASAGGLEALEAFFAGLPKTDGAAFVVVIHLAPDQESRMAEVLDRAVPIPVTQVTERVEVEPGRVYVIPPNRNLLMEDGHLRLAPLESERVRRRPIDHFFRTLAEAYGERSIGVVLSGTGQNGTVGVSRVRELGGLVLAQDPDDAAFDEMPRSALASGVVDHVAPASALGREAVDYADRLRRARVPDGEAVAPDDVRTVQRILALLKSRTGHDFAHYKRSTVLRRLARRVHVVGADGLGGYYEDLRRRPVEAEALLDDLLISVTNFFRDREAFAVLEEVVVPRLFEGKRSGDEVRVWAAGCATGEEAYSVAILLAEHAATLADPPTVQVFATDLSERAIRTARAGVYPESVEADVSPERLRRFFRRVQGGYQVTPALRETVLFAPHSLLKDPPFAHLDLVTCRNLLIYLQRDLQRRVLELFHYVLRPGGTLFLGSSETAEAAGQLWQAEDKSARVYRRRGAENVVPALPRSPRVPLPAVFEEPPGAAPPGPAGGPPSFAELHHQARAAAAPPSVLVTVDRQTVHVSEGAGPYLRLGEGEPTQNVLRLVLPPLRPAVQTALYGARRGGAAVASSPVRVEVEGVERAVTVRAAPVGEAELFQVAFEAAAPPAPRPTGDGAEALSAELQETQEQLQLSLEEFETSREELKAQNEELQSVNEELRSTAEELETAKEEAQSMAEELQTANDELKAKVDELAQATSDLENLVVSTEIATLFLDRGLRIKWFTPHVRRHFHVRDSDLGRPLSDLAPRFGGSPLVADAEAVLDRLQVREREVLGEDGRWYLVHARPYRSVTDRIDGVVVTFVDITARRASEEAVRESAEQFRALVSASAEVVWTADAEGRVVDDSPTWRAFTGQTAAERRGGGWLDAVHPDDRPALAAEWEGAVAEGRAVDRTFRLRHAGAGPWRWTHMRAVPLRDEGGAVRGWVGMNTDVTERREAEASRRTSEERYRVLVEGATEYAILMLDPDGRVTAWNEGAARIFGWDEAEVLGRPGALIFTEEDRAAGVPEAEMARATETGTADDDRRHVRKDGSRFWATGVMTALRHDDGRLRGFAKLLRDNTERRAVEEALRESEERFRQAVDAAHLGTWSCDPGAHVVRLDARARDIFGVDRERLPSAEVEALVHPDDRDAYAREAAAALDPDGPGTFAQTHRIVRPDGEVRWVQSQARVLFEGGGAGRGAARTVGVVVDVTEQRAAEEALRESEERFRRTAETVPDILFTTDAEGRVDYVNPRFQEVTGRPASDALGTQMWEDLVHPDDREAAHAVFNDGRERDEPYEVRHRLGTGDGDYRWFLTRVQPVRGAGGGVDAWFGTSTDVDRIVRAEEEVQGLNETLERRVRQRTALARRLLARLTVAEEEERRRIALVLHDDLQQRLYGLSMTLAVLRRKGEDPLVGRAVTVLDDALALTRTLAAELSPSVLRTDDLGEVCEWLADHARSRYGLAVEVDATGGCRVADKTVRVTVYQVLRELLFNVAKHAGTDQARIEVRCDPDEVVVVVEDEGGGFDTSAVGGAGTGLGLAGVRSRLELVGGRVEVASAPGEGTRVTIAAPSGGAADE